MCCGSLHFCPNSPDAVLRLVFSASLKALLKSHVLYVIRPSTTDKLVFQSLSCITYTAQWESWIINHEWSSYPYIRSLFVLPNCPTEKLDDKPMCQPGGAETLPMVGGNYAHICIHYQLWKKSSLRGPPCSTMQHGQDSLFHKWGVCNRLNIRVMVHLHPPLFHMALNAVCCKNRGTVLISGVNEDQWGAEKKTRGF